MSAELPVALVAVWVALVGAALGSFLNVVIARVPTGESVVHPRSRCPGCRAPIAWYDNLPVVSWILLRARCRGCGAPISARYPLVEALVAAAALLAWRRHGLAAPALAELAFVALLLALAFIDLDTWLLPHALTFPVIGLGLACGALGLAPAGGAAAAAWGAGIGFAVFAVVSVVGERAFRRPALGFGDVWLLSGIGAFLGARALLPVVLLSSTQGAVVGLALMWLGRMPRDPDVPDPAVPAPPARESGVAPGAAEAPPEADAPARRDPDGADADVPAPANAVPFGPFLAAAALQWLYLADVLARAIPALDPFR
jgi:leader peptidase (prepilin peptidase)/N-methyltransferase